MNFVFKENMIMSKNSSNKIVVPEAKEAMNKFKMEAANEVGVLNTSKSLAAFNLAIVLRPLL